MHGPQNLYATPKRVLDAQKCHFYHVMEIPGYGVTNSAQWDLRGAEEEYLGHVSLKGRRVLEIGPASGYLTFYMEGQGADVVAVELSPDLDWDIVPDRSIDMPEFVATRRSGIESTRNAFWYAHERLGSQARVHYGNVYDLPLELGRFDVAVLCSVLLHMRDPLHVLEACSRLADTLVVTDMYYPDFPNDRPMMQFFPLPDEPSPDLWWRFTPQLFVRFGEVLGYTSNAVSLHEQMYLLDGRARPATMFTVVSSDREAAGN